MYRKIVNWILALGFAVSVGGVAATTAIPQYASAASCAQPILTFPVWYRNLPTDADCGLEGPAQLPGGLSEYIWIIVLNVVEIGLQAVAYMTIFFIIYGGFRFMTSAGSSDEIVKARKTITNAVIGLVISIASVAIVRLIAGAIS